MTDKEAVEAVARAILSINSGNGQCLVQDWDAEYRDNVHVKKAVDMATAALAAARPHILEEAARIAETAVYKRKAMICACSEGLADFTATAIRAAKETSE